MYSCQRIFDTSGQLNHKLYTTNKYVLSDSKNNINTIGQSSFDA